MNTDTPEHRLLTPKEVGRVVLLFREEHGWTQETLAELAGVTPRTIQRLEAGQPASLDTRRAVGNAFRFEDADWLSKPMPMPTQEDLQAQHTAFERDYLVLDAVPVDGRKLMAILLDHGCDGLTATGLSELPEPVREPFAAVLDFIRDCMDVADVAPRTELLGYGDQLEEMAAPLREAGFCLSAATRKTRVSKPGWVTPMEVAIVYLSATPSAQAPSKMAVSRRMEFGRL